MIKLAIISDDPGIGGAYKVSKDIAYGLPKDEYSFKFFFLCEKPKNEDAPEGIYLGSQLFSFNYSLISYIKLAFFPTKQQKEFIPLLNELNEFEPDLIHFHSHPITLSFIKYIKNHLKKGRFLFTDHLQRISKINNKYGIKNRLLAIVYSKLYENAFTVFISPLALKTAKELKFALFQKHTLILNTVDTTIFKQNENKNSSLKIVYLARITEIKGHELLLQAWKLIPHTDGLELELYGIEADNGVVRNLIASTNFPNPVSYCGVTNTPEKVLQAASIGVFPSYREGMPLALLEMMASELPVVASDIPEISTIVNDKVDVLLFKCGDAKDLSEKLISVIQDEQLRNQLGKQARKTVEEKYATPLWISYQNVYTRLLNQ